MQAREFSRTDMLWLKERIDSINESYQQIVVDRGAGVIGLFRRFGNYLSPGSFLGNGSELKVKSLNAVAKKQEVTVTVKEKSDTKETYAIIYDNKFIEHTSNTYQDHRLYKNLAELSDQLKKLEAKSNKSPIQAKQIALLNQQIKQNEDAILQLSSESSHQSSEESNAHEKFIYLFRLIQRQFVTALGVAPDSLEGSERMRKVNNEPYHYHFLRMVAVTLSDISDMYSEYGLPFEDGVEKLVNMIMNKSHLQEQYHFVMPALESRNVCSF